MGIQGICMHDGLESVGADGDVTGPKRRKGIYVLPNLFTLAALFGGFYSIVMAMNGRFDLAAIGVFCAMVLDSLDGRVARMTNTQSAFGEQMDSLSDMVSFGAAPALIAYEWALRGLGRWGWFAAFVYCACAALRLARFNVNTGVVDKRYFQGLPSPAAAALVVGFIGLCTDLGLGVADVFLGAVCGLDDGDQCAVLQFQRFKYEAKCAFCGDRFDCFGYCGNQHRSTYGFVRTVCGIWRQWLCSLRLAQNPRLANQRD
jgi:CDP-diacylglycerol--serine O-phosphatidyltransferase